MTEPDNNSTISFKNLNFTWKQFLSKNGLPSVINQASFKSILQNDLMIYNINNDSCIKIKLKHHEYYTYFQLFWKENIIYNEDDYNYYEISEITTIFNDWCKNKCNIILKEEEIKELILWNSPEINIEDNKYIHNITCKIWDKTTLIDLAIQSFNQGLNASFNTLDLYKYYCKFVNKNYDGKYITSKNYFDKYIDK